MGNPGFFYDFQLIDVGDFNGVGESEPNPYFFQVNLNCFTLVRMINSPMRVRKAYLFLLQGAACIGDMMLTGGFMTIIRQLYLLRLISLDFVRYLK